MSKRNKDKKKFKDKKKKKRFYKKVSFYLITIPIISLGVVGYKTYQKFNPILNQYVQDGYAISNTVSKEQFTQQVPTRIFDSKGNVIKELNTYAKYQVNNQNVNPILKKGFVAVEDKRFYQHNGVDLYSTIRATISTLLGKGTQGGSTLTQQLVKNKILHNQEQTMSRKVTEMVVAQDLSEKLSKDEVLVSYLNESWFGRGATGVGAASRVYFDKDQKDLTVREASVIIGLTNNPSLFDPWTQPEETLKKSNTILKVLLENNVITLSEYNKAIKEPIKPKQGFIENSKEYTDNYAVSFAVTSAAKELAKNDDFKFKYTFKTEKEYQDYHKEYLGVLNKEIDKITAGGYDIHTTIDTDLQNKVQEDVKSQLSISPEINPETGKPNLQAAVTVIDNASGNTVVSVGGRGTDESSLNRAYQSFRQPGSTEKPLLGYGPAFDKGVLVPQSPILDAQIPEYPTVTDYFGSWYNKSFTARSALEQSLNTPAIRASMMSGPIEENLQYLDKMKFSQLHPSDNTQVSVIGGLTVGVSTQEQAAAYATIANQGKYRNSSNVTEIKDRYKNKDVYSGNKEETPVYKPSTSYMLIDMMKTAAQGITVTTPALADNYPKDLQAGKTGSTDYYKDVWFVSTNAYYTTAVWVGNDNNTPIAEPYKGQAMAISKKVATDALNGKTPKDFVKPDSVNKNGDNLTVVKDDSISDSNKESEYSNFVKQQQQKTTQLNKERLDSQDYRIIYGLSEKEEKSREMKASKEVAELEKVQDTFTLDEYTEVSADISKAKLEIMNVKNRTSYSKLNKELETIETKVNNRYSALLSDKQMSTASKEETIIANKKEKLNKESQDKVDALLKDLEKQKTIVTESKKDEISKELNKLDDIVNQLNKLGYQTPYYKVVSDGQENILFEGQSPSITKE